MIEVIPKLFAGDKNDVSEWKGEKKTIVCVSQGFDMPNNVVWIPLFINEKIRKYQLNLLSIALYGELGNNNNILVYGDLQDVATGLAFFLKTIKEISIFDAFKIIYDKLPDAKNLIIDIEQSVYI